MLDKLSNREHELRQEARDIVRDLVRLNGSKQAVAFDGVARATGLSPRRVKSHFHGEPMTLAAHEIEALRQAMLDAMEAEERRAAHRAAIWRARLGAHSSSLASAAGAFLVSKTPHAA